MLFDDRTTGRIISKANRQRLLFLTMGCSVFAASCKDQPTPPSVDAASARPSAAVVSVASVVSSAAPADPPPFAEKEIAAGRLEDGAWTPSFTVERKPGNNGLTHLEAQRSCSTIGESLCSDAQWTRACAAHPSLGALEAWTITGIGKQRFVVRGGKGGCDRREVVTGTDRHPSRLAVCCSRAVGLVTSNPNTAFLKAVTKRLVDYETALAKHDLLALGKQYDDTVLFHGKELAQSVLIGLHGADFEKDPNQWTLFDTCQVSIEKGAKESQLVSDCRAVFYRNGRTLAGMQRLIWGGPDTKLQAIGDATTKKTPDAPNDFEGEPEEKERVGVLLVAD